MDNIATAKIKAFGKSPKVDFVSPSEQLITLTIGQLQDLIKEAIQPLQDEVESFRVTVARQDEKISALEATQDTHADNSLIQLRLINDLREDVHRAAAPAPTKKTTSHIDQLHKLMLEEKSQQVSIVKGARLLGISKERMRLLKPLILKDGRFELSWSTIKGKKAVVIRIRKFL